MTIELINQYDEKRTVYPLDRDILIPHPFNLNDTLQHLDGQINCAIPYDPEIHKFLVENSFLKSKVYNEETQTIFTGVVKDGLEWIDNGTPEPLNEISLTLQDNSYYLNNTPEEDITYINQSLTTILADVCKRCNLQIGSNLPTDKISVAQIKQNTTYLNFINDILFQHCYAFGFDANGVLQTINIKEMETSEVFDDFFSGLKFTKTTKNYNAIHLKYGELTVKQNEQVYYEGGEISSDNTIQPIIIQPNAYYPPEATPIIEEQDGKVIQNFSDGFAQAVTLFNGEKKYQRSKNTELIYTEDHVVTKDYSDNLTLDRTDFTATSASVRFYNNSATDAELYQLAIRATAYYRRPKKLILGEGKKFEYEAIYIYDSQRASTFANFLSKYFLGGNYKIAARTEKNFLPGTKLTLKTGISGIATRAIVISSTYNPREKNYNITFLTETDLALSPKFYQDRHTSQFPGPKGDKGEQGVRGSLEFSGTEIDSFDVSDKAYTITTASIGITSNDMNISVGDTYLHTVSQDVWVCTKEGTPTTALWRHQGRRVRDKDDSNLFRLFSVDSPYITSEAKSEIVEGTNPFGVKSKLIKISNKNGTLYSKAAIYGKKIPINSGKSYRYVAYIKKNDIIYNDYFGIRNASASTSNEISLLDGSVTDNGYHVSGAFGPLEDWYLIVGYVMASDKTEAPLDSGVYNCSSKKKIKSCKNFKWVQGVKYTFHYGTQLRFADVAHSGEETDSVCYLYDIRFDEVNGTEPSLTELLYGQQYDTLTLESLEQGGGTIGQLGLFQGQLYKWNGTSWDLTEGVLPTDPVLHYSFDELPDLPDGGAVIYNKNKNWTSTDSFSGSSSISVENGCLVLGGKEEGSYAYRFFSTHSGCYVKIKMSYDTSGSVAVYENVTKDSVLTILNFTENEEKTVILKLSDNNRLIGFSRFAGKVTIKELYIGDASYTTPIIDNSGNNNNSTTTRGIVVDGINNKGLFLDKQALGRSFKMPSDFTVSLWCKAENNTKGLYQNIVYTNNNAFIIRNGASWGDYLMYYVFTQKEDGSYDNVGRAFLPNGGLLPANVWVNLAITKKDNIIKCYYNGELKKIDTRETGVLAYNDYLSIGNSTNTREQTIDDFQIFDRALSDQEVLGLYLARGNTPKQYTRADYEIEHKPRYLGIATSSAPSNPSKDSWFTAADNFESFIKGHVYQWNGIEWIKLDPLDSTKSEMFMTALNDILGTKASEDGYFSTIFAKALIANQAFIKNLQSQVITLTQALNADGTLNTNTGIIQSQNYLDTNGEEGWQIKANGSAVFKTGNFENIVIEKENTMNGSIIIDNNTYLGNSSTGYYSKGVCSKNFSYENATGFNLYTVGGTGYLRSDFINAKGFTRIKGHPVEMTGAFCFDFITKNDRVLYAKSDQGWKITSFFTSNKVKDYTTFPFSTVCLRGYNETDDGDEEGTYEMSNFQIYLSNNVVYVYGVKKIFKKGNAYWNSALIAKVTDSEITSPYFDYISEIAFFF